MKDKPKTEDDEESCSTVTASHDSSSSSSQELAPKDPGDADNQPERSA